MKNKHLGSSFDDFLRKENLHDEVETVAIKRIVAFQLQKALLQKQISKSSLAKRMKTSRSEVSRLLDPENDSLTLATLHRAAIALGKKLDIRLL